MATELVEVVRNGRYVYAAIEYETERQRTNALTRITRSEALGTPDLNRTTNEPNGKVAILKDKEGKPVRPEPGTPGIVRGTSTGRAPTRGGRRRTTGRAPTRRNR